MWATVNLKLLYPGLLLGVNDGKKPNKLPQEECESEGGRKAQPYKYPR
jgi:hypothetical protein